MEVWTQGGTITVNSCDELTELVSEVLEELLSMTKKAKVTDAIFKFGDSFDNIQLLDRRTEQFLETYSFYKNNPHKAFNHVSEAWFQAYNIIDNYQPSIF